MPGLSKVEVQYSSPGFFNGITGYSTDRLDCTAAHSSVENNF